MTTTTTTTTTNATAAATAAAPALQVKDSDILSVVVLTKKQLASFATAQRANDASDLATSNNKTLQSFGLTQLAANQLAKAVAAMQTGQMTPACRLVDSWLAHEFGPLAGNSQKDLALYISSAQVAISGLKAVKTVERKSAALWRVQPIIDALMVRLTVK